MVSLGTLFRAVKLWNVLQRRRAPHMTALPCRAPPPHQPCHAMKWGEVLFQLTSTSKEVRAGVVQATLLPRPLGTPIQCGSGGPSTVWTKMTGTKNDGEKIARKN